jgi:hypothetical protein
MKTHSTPTLAAVDQPRLVLRLRGFRVICDKWSPPLSTIVRARSASKARFKCWDSAKDVGYRLKIGDFKVRRAPEYDDAKLIEGRCYGEDFARSILPENVDVQP